MVMILALNIYKTILSGLNVSNSTRRAWRLNRVRLNKMIANGPVYVIGVVKGNAKGYFQLVSVRQDNIQRNRVRLKLKRCTKNQTTAIKRRIVGTRFYRFVAKYI